MTIFFHISQQRNLKNINLLFRKEKVCTTFFFILNGCLKSYFTDRNGKEHILAFGMQDWWITEYEGYYNQSKATRNIDCIEDSELLYLSFENREKLCAEIHK